MATVFLLSNSFSDGGLRCLHFYPWRFLMSLTFVLGSFFAALTTFSSSAAVIFLDRPVRCRFGRTALGSFFIRTFQMVAFFSAQCLYNGHDRFFLFFSQFLPRLSYRQLSGLYVGVSFFPPTDVVYTGETKCSNTWGVGNTWAAKKKTPVVQHF